MSHSICKSVEKKLIRVDISSDTVCAWCLIGKRNLDHAMASSKHQFDFEVRWHPYILDPSAPKEGVPKKDLFMKKLGSRYEGAVARLTEVFRSLGLEYNLSGLTGNTMDSHRLIALAGHQGLDKQHALVEELFLGYFTQGKYIGDRDIQKYSNNSEGIPYYVINGKQKISGGHPPEVFLRAFLEAANDSD